RSRRVGGARDGGEPRLHRTGDPAHLVADARVGARGRAARGDTRDRQQAGGLPATRNAAAGRAGRDRSRSDVRPAFRRGRAIPGDLLVATHYGTQSPPEFIVDVVKSPKSMT